PDIHVTVAVRAAEPGRANEVGRPAVECPADGPARGVEVVKLDGSQQVGALFGGHFFSPSRLASSRQSANRVTPSGGSPCGVHGRAGTHTSTPGGPALR